MPIRNDGGLIIERLGYRLSGWVERWMPSPFLFAFILTYIVFIAGLAATESGALELVGYWYDGFWAFRTVSMQMVLTLMTEFVVAYHPRVTPGSDDWRASPTPGSKRW